MALRWRFHPDRPHSQRLLARGLGLSEVAARILVNRGLETPEQARRFLEPRIGAHAAPDRLPDVEIAVERLLEARRRRERVVVFGDSDADGVCGTALLTTALSRFGWDVRPLLPDRLREGYSLTDAALRRILAERPALVVTVDNGTTAADAIESLQAAGVDVVVLDHHEVPDGASRPLALVNPKRRDAAHAFPHLCGAGLAFQLVTLLFEHIPAPRGPSVLEDLFAHLASLAAIGTVCDVMPLVGENRALVRLGLAALSRTEHPGLRALLRAARVGRNVRAEDIGFRIGPRLNAAGRLGRAEPALELLLCRDEAEARRLARRLNEVNAKRQNVEAEVLREAALVAEEAARGGAPVVVLHGERWHPGVLGIVAGRLARRLDRPVVLLGGEGPLLRGSGRSAGSTDLVALLGRAAQWVRSYGGHAAAAGLELERRNLAPFVAELERAARALERRPAPELWIDAELPIGTVDLRLLAEIERLGPFGEGVPAPVFASTRLRAGRDVRLVGRNEDHVTLEILQSGASRRAVGFGLAGHVERLSDGAEFQAAFTPRLGFHRGRADIQLELKDIRFAGSEE